MSRVNRIRVEERRTATRRDVSRRVALVLLVLSSCTLVSTAVARAQTDPPERYGKAPDEVIPFRHFKEPYKRFFDKLPEFLGNRAPQSAKKPAIKIGFMGPIGEAPDAELGERMLEGMRLAVEEANAAGGYKGTPYEIVVRPDSGLWGASSNVMVAFRYEDDAVAVLGSIDGANTHIALRVALKTQTPMINSGSTDPTMTETMIPWIVRCVADDRQQGYALAQHIFVESGLERVVAFRVNDRYGRTGIGEFRDAARRLKHPLLTELRWNRGERDFSAQLDRIAAFDPDAIVLWGTASDCAAVTRAIRQRGLRARLFGSDRIVSQAFLDEAGDAAEGVVGAASYNPESGDPRLLAFVEAYAKRFGRAPETFAAHAYDGTRLLLDAIAKNGPTRLGIRDALFEVKRYDGVTGRIEFDTTMNDVGPVFLAKVENGRFRFEEVRFGARGTDEPYRRMVDAAPDARSPEKAGPAEGPIRIGAYLPLDDKGRAIVDGAREALTEDARSHPDERAIELLVRGAGAPWGADTTALVGLAYDDEVLAILGSTERRGTHVVEMLATRMHFPVLPLCADDPSINAIPLPWVFTVDRRPSPPGGGDPVGATDIPAPSGPRALGYDAAALLARCIRGGAETRRSLRDALAEGDWYRGRTGVFRFDDLGNRVDRDLELTPR